MATDATHDTADPTVTLVNRFTLRAETAEFERAFAASSAFLASRPGFIEHTLLRELGDTPRYVNIARWTDEASLRAAVNHPEFATHAAVLRALSSTEPVLYSPRLHCTAEQAAA